MNLKRVCVFLEFLVSGIILGIIEDVILIKLITNEQVTYSILIVIFLVVLPFAFLGEYIIDRMDFLKIFKLNKKYKKIEVFLEFLVFGIFLGIIEDLTAFYFAIGNPISYNVVLVATIIAVPFAIFSEFFIDNVDFLKIIKRGLKGIDTIWKKT